MLLGACGKKSEIKNAVRAEKLPESYSLVFPLTEQEIASFDTPTKNIGFLAGGIAAMFINLGTKIGMGKAEINLTQPVPPLPKEYLSGLRIKRVFFYIEPKEGPRKQSWFQKLINGKEDVDFNFIDKIAVTLQTEKIQDPKSYTPTTESKILAKESQLIKKIFETASLKNVPLPNDDLVLIKYEKANRDQFLRNDNFGKIYVIKTDHPAETRFFLEDHYRLRNHFKRVHTLSSSILIELKKDPLIEENFNQVLADSKEDLDHLDVERIDECTKQTCLDFAVPGNNLLPLIFKENGIKLNTFIDTGKVPPSFQLKGFVEFEIKINSPI